MIHSSRLLVPVIVAALAAGLLAAPVRPDDELRARMGSAARSNEEGVKAMARREYDRAVERFREALELLPGSEPVTANLRHALLSRGVAESSIDLESAERDLRDAAALAPDDPAVLRNLGILLARREKWDEAAEVLERLLARQPDSVESMVTLAQVLYRNGRLERAIELLAAAARLRPDDESISSLLLKASRENEVEGRFAREHTSRFDVAFDGERESPEVVSQVLADLEEAASRVDSDLAFTPPSKVPVMLYSAREFASVTGSHGWIGALFDGKIRIPLKDYALHRTDLVRTLAHEYTHYVVSILAPRAPSWLNEGLAQYEEQPGSGLSADRLEALRAARDDGSLPRIATLTSSFSGIPDRERARLLYAQSLSCVAYLVDRFGMARVKELLLATRKTTLAAAFQEAFGEPLASVEDAWRGTF